MIEASASPPPDPVDKLVRMANQVATFFRAYPEAQARAGVRDHLVAFWTPKMRATLLARADGLGARLDPLVAAALAAPLGAEPTDGTTGEPAGERRAQSPIRRELAGPDELGRMASDAG